MTTNSRDLATGFRYDPHTVRNYSQPGHVRDSRIANDKIHYRVRNEPGGESVPSRDLIPIGKKSLTPAELIALSDVPPKLEWLANITIAKTRRAYKVDVAEFLIFSGLKDHTALRSITRAPVLAWQRHGVARACSDHDSAQAFGLVVTV